uniref:Orotidine 5'-phosphate decarboxylase n=1 Tax=Maylandia zebra TaxID=106582 RepID=A0A3P9DAM6_9CICH
LDDTTSCSASTDSLILKLHDVNGVKFGEYKLKSGLLAPIYIHLRVLVSHPALTHQVTTCCLHDWAAVPLCVPYTALPLATVTCSRYELPLVIRQKEAKDYGELPSTDFQKGDTCLIIEDTVTSGTSSLETAEGLCKEVVLMDREQGGVEMLASKGIKLHPIISMSQLLRVLQAAERIDAQTSQSVHKFIRDNNTFCPKNGSDSPASKKLELSYSERAELGNIYLLASKLLKIMEEKQSNLCVSADVTNSEELLQLAESLGPKICMLKTHADILEDYTSAFIQNMQALAEKHNFLIFEDHKFADIGNTVKRQYDGGLYQISSWSHIVNAHAVPGVVKGLSAVGKPLGRGCLLIAQMSCQGTLAAGEYTKAAVQMAEEHSDSVMGFICGSKLTERPEFIHMTPGVQMQAGGKSDCTHGYTVHAFSGTSFVVVTRGAPSSTDCTPEGEACTVSDQEIQRFV